MEGGSERGTAKKEILPETRPMERRGRLDGGSGEPSGRLEIWKTKRGPAKGAKL